MQLKYFILYEKVILILSPTLTLSPLRRLLAWHQCRLWLMDGRLNHVCISVFIFSSRKHFPRLTLMKLFWGLYAQIDVFQVQSKLIWFDAFDWNVFRVFNTKGQNSLLVYNRLFSTVQLSEGCVCICLLAVCSACWLLCQLCCLVDKVFFFLWWCSCLSV